MIPPKNPQSADIPQEASTAISRRRLIRASAALGVGLAFGFEERPAHAASTTSLSPHRPEDGRLAIFDSARPLPLGAVRVTGGPLKHAQDLDRQYLLKLEPDRMMANFRKRAGLTPKAEGYGGWDGGGRNLTGHIAGHYLSAVSLMYAATGDLRFKARAEEMVKQFSEVQDQDGYLGALQDKDGVDGKKLFEDISRGVIRSGGFDLNGLWSPWYVEHKIYAGLRDAYRHTGSSAALEIETKFAAWAESIVGNLTDVQVQQMLATEFGGMNEVFADLYGDTGDARWLRLSDRFQHRNALNPLESHQDKLGGMHANEQIPKLLGSLARYRYTGAEKDGTAASFFWDAVVNHHTFATGGHGKDEYFGPADKLSDIVDGRTDESCNVYNMLKMTRQLFALKPDIKYAEFQERALFNHVLGSIDPADGRTCYMVPVGRSVQREYSDMLESFTCCVGTGMENHALHAHGIYYENGRRLWVNLYTPSTALWKEAGVTLTMTTQFPEGESVILRLQLESPKTFMLSLRRPSWAAEGFTVVVNGAQVENLSAPGTYIDLDQTWENGDIIVITLPKTLHIQPLSDNQRRAALMWGPLVLAGDLGPERGWNEARPPSPVLVAANRPITEWLKPASNASGNFLTQHVGQKNDVELVPFYRLHGRTYSAYWDLYTPAEWAKKAAEIAAEEERQRKLEAATVGFAQPGEMQPERDFNQQGEDSRPDRVMGRPGRRGTKWFSFDLPVDPVKPMTLVVTYHSAHRRKCDFDILVDGKRVGHQTIDRSAPGAETRFFDVQYALPTELVQGKTKVTVRFEATGGTEIATVFGIRTIR